MTLIADTLTALEHVQSVELRGQVAQVRGLALHVADLSLPVGATVRVHTRTGPIEGEVVGFDRDITVVMPLGHTTGVSRGDIVVGLSLVPTALVGHGLLGRVLDGLGRPIDGRGSVQGASRRPLLSTPTDPMSRPPIDRFLATGIRAIDAMLTVGVGQRVGIFSGSGVGKSTLLGAIARHTAADVSVVALIGERGREVGDFVRNHLGPEGIRRTVVIAATADEPPLIRIRAAWLACAVAEHFRDAGLNALLVMDSVTRFAQSQRQVGLAAGEPPATRGYPPSVFAAIPNLLERSGTASTGSITGFYSILVEGDDLNEPIADACRSTLDGHIVLSRDLAERGHYPAIDVSASISRVAPRVTDEPHRLARAQIAHLITAYRRIEEMLAAGAYAAGSDPMADVAIQMKQEIDGLLTQESSGQVTFQDAKRELLRVATAAARLSVKQSRRVKPI